MDGTQIAVVDATTDVLVSSVDTGRPGRGNAAGQSALFEATVTAPWTGERPLLVDTPRLFEGPFGLEHFPLGTLRAVAADGSVLTVNADNGDPDSFLPIVESAGSTSAFTVPWSADTTLPCVREYTALPRPSDSRPCR